MRTAIRHAFLTALLLAITPATAQETTGAQPLSIRLQLPAAGVPTLEASAFDRAAADAEDASRAEDGKLPLYARFVAVHADPATNGLWTELPNGDRIWRVLLHSDGALATELFFTEAHLPPGSQLHVHSPDGSEMHGGYTDAHVQADGSLSTEMIMGEVCMVEYHEPAAVRGEGSFRMERLLHAYRFLDALSGACQVDVICPEGAAWQDQRDAVMRIRVVIPSGAGFCTGTLVNNTARDCKGYILTAFHCTEESVEANYASYLFRFNYQRTGCGTGNTTSNSLTGCARRAGSQDQGGALGSDFTLLELTPAIPAAFNPYWAGWDIGTSTPLNGVCIHHPDADVKKISTYTAAASNATWGGVANSSHWMVTWSATASGHGVTEVGSSGSPLFNTNKRVVGTLTGGSSCCTTNGCGSGTSLTAPDFYGKMSFHFGNGNPNPANERLSAWLSPVGAPAFLEGSRNPCVDIGVMEHELPRLSLAPNPATNTVDVSLAIPMRGKTRLQCADLTGRIVSEHAFQGSTMVIDVAGLPVGTYMVKLVSADQQVAASRLVVAR